MARRKAKRIPKKTRIFDETLWVLLEVLIVSIIGSCIAVFLYKPLWDNEAWFWIIAFVLSAACILGIVAAKLYLDKHKRRWAIPALFIGFIALLITIYLFWPFKLTLQFVNPLGDPVQAELQISNGIQRTIAGQEDTITTHLWKGTYTAYITSEGYYPGMIPIDNKMGFKINKDISLVVKLDPQIIHLSEYHFYDPTYNVELSVWVDLDGKDIMGQPVKKTITQDDSFIYGNYSARMYDDNFEQWLTFNGFDLYRKKVWQAENSTRLMPNWQFNMLTIKEVETLQKFIDDYTEYSAKGYIPDMFPAFPEQFYLVSKETSISAGDMAFLFCEFRAYEKSLKQKRLGEEDVVLFIPKSFQYEPIEQAHDAIDCYANALEEKIPFAIGDQKTFDAIAKRALRDSDFRLSRREEIPFAITYDVESGRYVHEGNKDEHSVSPCLEDGEGTIGIDMEDLNCDDADWIPWYTDYDSSRGVREEPYPYPWFTSLSGYDFMLNISEEYGIPATHFMVGREIEAYEKYRPDLMKRLKDLVDDDLAEIGTHTHYQSNLCRMSALDPDCCSDDKLARCTVKDEEKDRIVKYLKGSVDYLREYFNTDVKGLRTPYLALIGNTAKRHAKVLAKTPIEYDTSLEDYFGNFSLKQYNGVDFPTTNLPYLAGFYYDVPYYESGQYGHFALVKRFSETNTPIMSLDHPWNVYYTDDTQLYPHIGGDIHFRAMVLTILSAGYAPMNGVEFIDAVGKIEE